VFVTPLDKDDVVASLLDDVVDAVPVAADVLDDHLLAGHFRPEDSDEQTVVSWNRCYETFFSDGGTKKRGCKHSSLLVWSFRDIEYKLPILQTYYNSK
jgi:hypothetical protein